MQTAGSARGSARCWATPALRTDTSDNLYLPISQIEPYANQPRRHFDEEALQDLADSIREHGIIQPLTVRRLSSGYYQIIAGERRLARRAHRPVLPKCPPSSSRRMTAR